MPTRHRALAKGSPAQVPLRENTPWVVNPSSSFIRIRGERVQPTSITATDAKNEFARALETALRGQPVVITKHDEPKAVLISMEDFHALSESAETKLNSLSAEFDAMLEGMQKRKSVDAMKAAFDASPRELGRTAKRAARRRV